MRDIVAASGVYPALLPTTPVVKEHEEGSVRRGPITEDVGEEGKAVSSSFSQ